MVEDMVAFVKQCLHYMNGKAGALKPHPLEEVVHGVELSEVVYFDFLHIEAGGGVGGQRC